MYLKIEIVHSDVVFVSPAPMSNMMGDFVCVTLFDQ